MQRSRHLCHSPQGCSVPARTCRSIPRTESSPYPRKRSVARRMLYSSGLALVLVSFLQSIPTTSAQVDEPYDPDVSRLVGRFLHITDIHPDEHYIAGGSISSSCHRNSTDSDDDDLRIMRPGRTDGGIGGVYGSPYSICDSPFSLSNATFDWIDKNLINNIDFVVWTGDNARWVLFLFLIPPSCQWIWVTSQTSTNTQQGGTSNTFVLCYLFFFFEILRDCICTLHPDKKNCTRVTLHGLSSQPGFDLPMGGCILLPFFPFLFVVHQYRTWIPVVSSCWT